MIVSFKDKRTREFAEGRRIKAFEEIERKAHMKLDQLDAAISLTDLDLPGNRLEGLKGDRKGQFSIRTTTAGGFALNGPMVQAVQAMSKSSIITEVEYGTARDTSRRAPRRAA